MGEEYNNPKNHAVKQEDSPMQNATDQWSQRYIKYLKIEYDLLKHLMTLSVAAIAAFGTLLGIFHATQQLQPATVNLAGFSFSCLFLAAFFAGVQAWTVKDKLLRGQEPKNAEEVRKHLESGKRPGRIPLWALLLGVGAFMGVVVINLSN